jgi:hypothetical protein
MTVPSRIGAGGEHAMEFLLRYLFAGLAIVCPWCQSVVVDSETHTWTLDDFEDGNLKAASGLSWIVIADDLAGGATEARLEIRSGGSKNSRHSLRLTATFGQRKPSFAGAWVGLEREGRNLDLSAFEGIRLRVKGPGHLDVGFRSGTVNFMARIESGPDWRSFNIPFSTLLPSGKAPDGTKWNASTLQVFGITTPQSPTAGNATGRSSFDVDDVTFYGSGTSRMEPKVSGRPTGVMVVPFAKLTAIPVSGWTRLARDPERDGRVPSLPDATNLEVIPSTAANMLWARITLREPPNDRWIGINLALDIDGDPANGYAWWGANTAFKFDRIVTVWCFHVADGCQGFIGMADAAQAASGNFVAGGGTQLRFAIDRDRRALVLGIPRSLLGLKTTDIRLVAAVGSALLFADDVPGQGAAVVR